MIYVPFSESSAFTQKKELMEGLFFAIRLGRTHAALHTAGALQSTRPELHWDLQDSCLVPRAKKKSYHKLVSKLMEIIPTTHRSDRTQEGEKLGTGGVPLSGSI